MVWNSRISILFDLRNTLRGCLVYMMNSFIEIVFMIAAIAVSFAFVSLTFIPYILRNQTIEKAGQDAGRVSSDENRKEYIQKVIYPSEDVYIESRGDDRFYVRNHDGEFIVTLRVRDNGGYEEKIKPIR